MQYSRRLGHILAIPTIVAIVASSIAALGLGVTLIVLIVKGSFLLGSLVNQVAGLTVAVGELRTEMQQSNQTLTAAINELRAETQQNSQTLTTAINELRVEVQQSNQTLAALANHTHDTDGRTVFQVPPGAGRQS